MADWDVTTVSELVISGANRAGFNAIDDTHYFTYWDGSGSKLYATVLNVDASTYAITTATTTINPADAVIEFECEAIDENHFLVVGRASNVLAKVFEVNTSTWEVTTASTQFVGPSNTATAKMIPVDTNHFLTHAGTINLTILEVNTSTWAITTATTDFELVNDGTMIGRDFQAVDDNHFLYIGADNSTEQFAYVIAVNTSTWAITTSTAKFVYDTAYQGLASTTYNNLVKIDDTHYAAFFSDDSTSDDGAVTILEVNTTTYAITTATTVLETPSGGQRNTGGGGILVSDDHLLTTWQGIDGDGFATVLAVNTSTWAITSATTKLEFDTTVLTAAGRLIEIDYDHFMGFGDGQTKFTVFAVEGVPEPPAPAASFTPSTITIF